MSDKASLEVLELLDKTADDIAAAKASGSVSPLDFINLILPTIRAIKDANLIAGEIKGYTEAELQEVIVKLTQDIVKLLQVTLDIKL